MGLGEGLHERSWATSLSGINGGALAGVLALLVLRSIYLFENDLGGLAVELDVSLPILHLGIGLSLALGRYIRDLPKRRAARPGGDTEPPGA